MVKRQGVLDNFSAVVPKKIKGWVISDFINSVFQYNRFVVTDVNELAKITTREVRCPQNSLEATQPLKVNSTLQIIFSVIEDQCSGGQRSSK